jgi:hypothetical protein
MLEEQAKKEAAASPSAGKKKDVQAPDGAALERKDVQSVYPLHYKRFSRRTSSGLPLRKPETPLYRSEPDQDAFIHSPKPVRSFPALATPADTPSTTRPILSRDTTQTSYITPVAFLQGTKNNCVRHGRSQLLSPQAATKQTSSTRDFVKSRDGGYMPTGLMQMRQVEATSPWVVQSKKADDACPDCVNELRIKRRELMQRSSDCLPPSPRPHTATKPASLLVEPPTSNRRVGYDISRAASRNSWESDERDLVVSKDLGNGLEAVIVEHKGDLRRVLLNSRHGKPSLETMQRLSKELAKVSNEVALAGMLHTSSGQPSATAAQDHSVVLNESSMSHDVRDTSVPELLDMIDQAANDIHVNTGRVAEHYITRRQQLHASGNSLLSNSELDEVFDDRPRNSEALVARQSIGEHYRALYEGLTQVSKSRRNTTKPTDPPLASKVVQQRITQTEQTKPPSAQTVKPVEKPPPQIITTKPTMPYARPPKSADVSPMQTPPPEHPSIHHAAQLTQSPSSLAPAYPTPKTPTSGHRSPFNWFNPFQRTIAPTTPVSSHPSPTPSATPELLHRVRPADESPPAITPQPISNHPNPYHHAPHEPLDLAYGNYSDPKVKEQQAVIRKAMRMERDRVQEAASRAEREGRRTRSAAKGWERKGEEGVERGRKGWFG